MSIKLSEVQSAVINVDKYLHLEMNARVQDLCFKAKGLLEQSAVFSAAELFKPILPWYAFRELEFRFMNLYKKSKN